MSWTQELRARVQADATTVFNLLAGVELWPALFQHVRSARVLRRDGQRRLVVVRVAWRGLPASYTAIVTADVDRCRLTIRHLSPMTRGSEATWTVSPTSELDDAVDVDVVQHVIVPLPIVGDLLARELIGGRVARDLGQSMLDRLKEVAEGGSLADRR
jgi:ribosome-associated toxin RatA of RatAB toxin-antitoxin module